MKKWVVLIIACLFTNILSQTNISPQFSELKGMEDQLGNTHLFYRVYTSYTNDPFYNMTNDIYHFDLTTFSDSLFLEEYSHSDPVMSYFRLVKDYTFWNDEYAKFIFCGSMGSWEPGPYIKRFDTPYNELNFICCEVNQIDISSFDDSLIYAGGYLYNVPQSNSIRSHDGGFTWETVNDTLVFLSLNPFDDNLLFFENLNGDIYRSIDAANSFHLVDVMNESGFSDSFLYDSDQLHIYRIYSEKTLRASPNKGEAFSWQTKYSSDSEIYVSIDESISGTIYLADKKNIFVSTDYGNSFSLYKSLDRKIVGIYKKPNSNKLYAATKYKIYEITPDTIQVINSLPIPQEILNYYPLAVGNKWVYLIKDVSWPYTRYYYGFTEVLSDTIAPNGKKYFYLIEDDYFYHPEKHFLERVDSLDGKVYRYYEDPLLPENEYVAYDLLAEVGDTIITPPPPYYVESRTYVVGVDTFFKWGLTKLRKHYWQYYGLYRTFSFTQDIGTDKSTIAVASGYWTESTLQGCIIDGLIYGDTTTVGLEDEETPIATTFNLEQNYPNPFNPSTVISYRLPVTSNVTLKVYDVLGNEIATLVNEEKPAGEYEVEFNAASHSGNVWNLTSGVYFYQLRTGDFIQTRKMVYLK